MLLASRFSLLASLLLILVSCAKEEFKPTLDEGATSVSPPIVFTFGGQQEIINKNAYPSGKRTALGADRQNPFTVAALDAAHLAVYGNKGQHATTDHYVAFAPSSLDELRTLAAEDLFLLDFPLTRRVITMGDYWYESKDSTDFPTYYATVPVGYQFPVVPYSIIADLDLSEGDTAVVAEAFRMTGNEEEYRATFGSKNWGDDFCFDNDTAIDIVLCGEPGDNGSGVTNDCGCEISTLQRYPAGCVQVDDTQYNNYQGVRRVRITGWNGWFTSQRTITDDNGCWNIKREYKGNAYFWLRFTDEDRLKLRVKGRNGFQPLEIYAAAQHYIGGLSGPNFNNIQVRFDRRLDDAQGTLGHFTWAAATVNNGVHEFHDMTAENCLNPVPDIDFLIRLKHNSNIDDPERRGNTGAAPMLRQIGYADFKDAASLGIANLGPPVPVAEQTLVYVFIRALLGVTWPVSDAILASELGDVNVTANYSTSDRQKHLVFHEMGHASHFAGVGETFWKRLIAAEIAAEGHGNPSSYEAGTIAIGESWAEHVALTMSSARYPSNMVGNSTLILSTWSNRHERIRNESTNHIPIGIFNDLLDGVDPDESVRDEKPANSGTLADNVNAIFDACSLQESLNSNHASLQSLRQTLTDELTAPEATSVSNLFSEYEQ